MLNPEWKHVYVRELRLYFNSAIGYVYSVCTLFIIFFWFFLGWYPAQPFWESREGTVENFFAVLPGVFVLLIPAITMRVWAEEYKNGTIELLRTLPLSEVDLVFGKFMATLSYVAAIILASLPLTLIVALISTNFDWGSTFAMYVGSILMGGAYVSVGMVVSALTKEQVVAFILVFVANGVLFIFHFAIFAIGLPEDWQGTLGFFSYSYHFSSFSRGVFDFADIYYYLSFIAVALGLNVWILRRER